MGNLLQSFSDLEKIKIKRQYKLVRITSNQKLESVYKIHSLEDKYHILKLSKLEDKSEYVYSIGYLKCFSNSLNNDGEIINGVIRIPYYQTLNQDNENEFSNIIIYSYIDLYFNLTIIQEFTIQNQVTIYQTKETNMYKIKINIQDQGLLQGENVELDALLDVYLDEEKTKKIDTVGILITLLFNSEEPEGD